MQDTKTERPRHGGQLFLKPALRGCLREGLAPRRDGPESRQRSGIPLGRIEEIARSMTLMAIGNAILPTNRNEPAPIRHA